MKNWRANFILILLILFGVIIIGRLFYIQILHHQYWKALAQGQQKLFVSLKGERGEIFFRDGTPLAINHKFDLVYAAPNEVEKPEETAEILGLILNSDEAAILEKLKRDSFYEIIKKKLTEKEISDLKEVNLAGIYLGEEMGRYYPFGDFASKVTGFLGGDNIGQYGVEGYYDKALQGEDGFLEKRRGPLGYLIDPGSQIKRGSDIILTLDYNIQFVAEKLLKSAKENLDFENGEIIVINPLSGEILALANFPNFDLNHYSGITNFEIFKNSSIQKIFEPGSVFKPITIAAALDQGKITPQTTYIDEGKVKIGGHTIHNYNRRTWGERTMTEVLEKSINTGAIFAGNQLGQQLFLDYIEKFGFFESTGIDLEGEVFSQNKEFRKGYEVNFATASFGHGIEITSLQLVRGFSAIINDGKLVSPYISKGQKESPGEQIISERTASQLTAMLVSVIENGFARRAKIPGYYAAGKTGTALVPWSSLGINKRGYSEKTIQSFIGFAPAFDPKFLILVKLNNPKTKDASASAVPIFRELAKYIINYWQIPPDYE